MTAAEIGVEVLSKFQEDLIRFAEANWCPSQVKMLKSAIDCVSRGEETYGEVEDD